MRYLITLMSGKIGTLPIPTLTLFFGSIARVGREQKKVMKRKGHLLCITLTGVGWDSKRCQIKPNWASMTTPTVVPKQVEPWRWILWFFNQLLTGIRASFKIPVLTA